MPINMPTTTQLKAARAMLGMNQDQLCRRVGFSPKTLTTVEAGVSSLLAYNMLVGALVGMGFTFRSNDDFSEQSMELNAEAPLFPTGIPEALLRAEA